MRSIFAAVLLAALALPVLMAQSSNPNDPWYDARWQRVERLRQEGQVRSAKATVDSIYVRATERGDQQVRVRAALVKASLAIVLEDETPTAEDALQGTDGAAMQAFAALDSALAGADATTRPILESHLAESYLIYFREKRWQIAQRTDVSGGSRSADITTWTLRDFADAARDRHRAALADPQALALTPVSQVQYLLEGAAREAGKGTTIPNGRTLRPTLLDLLGGQALDFYEADDLLTAFPEERYRLDEAAWFALPDGFAAADLGATPNGSLQAEATHVFQTITRTHLSDGDAGALLDVSLRRLAFGRTHSTLPDKDDRYERALRDLLERYRTTPHSSLVAFRLAEYLTGSASTRPRPGIRVRTVGSADDSDASGPDRARLAEALRLCESAVAQHPQTPGANACTGLVNRLRQASLYVEAPQFVEPNTPWLIASSYAMTDAAHLRVVPVTKAWIDRFERADYRTERPAMLSELYAMRPVEAVRHALPGGRDLGGHRVELPMQPRAAGHYALIVSADDRFAVPEVYGNQPFTFVHVTPVNGMLRAESSGTTLARVLDRASGRPLAGQTVRVLYNSDRGVTQVASTARTDERGEATVSVPSNQSWRYRIEAGQGEEAVVLGGAQGYYDGRPETSPQALVFTDRALYRPGQTIRFKAIVFSSNGRSGRVMAGQTVRVTLTAPNGTEVVTETMTTTEFGSVSGSFAAPTGTLTGAMSLAVTVDGNHAGAAQPRVEEYRRPTFEATFDDLEGTPRFGDPVTVTGKAVSYAGVPLQDASVRYRVVRQPVFPWWAWWWGGGRSEEEIVNGTVKTGSDGAFAVTFTPRPDPQDNPDSGVSYRYRVIADVTDVSGETQVGETAVNVGFRTLRASVVVPRVLDLANAPDTLALAVENLSGTSVDAAGTIRFDLLDGPRPALRDRLWAAPDTVAMAEAEHRRRFPHDPYGREKTAIPEWKTARTVATVDFDTRRARSVRLPSRMPEGAYRVTLRTTDNAGRPVETASYVTVLSATTRTMPVPALAFAELLTPSAKVGESARLVVGSSEPNVTVRVDVESDGRIVRTEYLTLSNEKRTIAVPVTDVLKDGFGFHVAAVRANRAFTNSFTVAVPRPERTLAVRLVTMRDRLLPGAQETWTLSVRGSDGERLAAETVLSMYDASLDAIAPHDWPKAFPWGTAWLRRPWQPLGVGVQTVAVHFEQPSTPDASIAYDALDRFGFGSFNAWSNRYARRVMSAAPSAVAPMQAGVVAEEMAIRGGRSEDVIEYVDGVPSPPPPPGAPAAKVSADSAASDEASARERLDGVSLRRNLQETAFFFPTLGTDADGNVTFAFTMPEALTRWNLFAFAHTPDLKAGFAKASTVTQKDLMVTPNLPRFVREGDRVRVTARLDNRSGGPLAGEAALLLFDAATMQPVDAALGNTNAVQRVNLAADSSMALAWTIAVPNDAAGQGSGAYVYRVVARTDRAEDGEEGLLPVLTNRTLVTETRPLPIRQGQTKVFTLDKLLASASDPTIQTQRLTLEFTPNPAWHAVTALPYLMEFPYECTEQTFSRYYANRLGSFIAQSDPRIREIFDRWRQTDAQALVSNLERNPELKSALLEQTPWVLDARDETERKRRVGVLMDVARMNAELETALRKLEDQQMSEGAWPWFAGGRDDRYITQTIVSGLGKLRHLGVTGEATGRIDRMNDRALDYLDAQMVRDYEELLRNRVDTARYEPSALTVHYLYTRSFYADREAQDDVRTALAFFRRKSAAAWRSYPMYTQMLLALSMHRTGHADVRERAVDGLNVAQRILRAARENARRDDELGMYWENTSGWFWWQAPIERQALTIEAFGEIAKDSEAVGEMRIWLLKQKQVQDWKTTRATVDAIYALLLDDGQRGGTTAQQRVVELLAEVPAVTIQVGAETFDVRRLAGQQEDGTGYFKQTWPGEAVSPDMGRVTVTMPASRTPVAWGALYWQYFQPLDRVTASQPGDGMADNPLRLRQELFVERASPSGPQLAALAPESGEVVRVGDVVVQRLVLRVDRAMEYVHMKSLRASGLDVDARDQASRWFYRDGLGWYQSARDASTDFFFPWLPVGTYVFEYRLRVRHAGDFSGALTSIQSMYAPEFAAHSAGHRLTVAE